MPRKQQVGALIGGRLLRRYVARNDS